MPAIEIIITGIAAVAVAITAGLLFGIFHAVYKYFFSYSMGRLNKKMGAKSYVIISGSPAAVKESYDVCIRVLNQIEQNQVETSEMEVRLANDQTNPETTKKKS